MPPLAHVLEHLPPQRERYYSIASSPLALPSSIQLLFPVVEFISPAPQRRQRTGLCTSWINFLATKLRQQQSDRQQEEQKDVKVSGGVREIIAPRVPITIRKAKGFSLPEDPSIPLVLICAGSGIAPFRHLPTSPRIPL